MSRFNIGTALGFARVTQSDVNGILNLFAGSDPSEWDILESSYNGVLFHIFNSSSDYQAAVSQVVDQGGRRKIKYVYPYVDGQTTDDLGRSPRHYDFDILIHGPEYLSGFADLLAEFAKPTPGTLIHPVLGSKNCVIENYQFIHSSEKRQAVAIRASFIEHDFTLGSRTVFFKDPTIKGALATAIATFANIETVIAHLQGVVGFARSIANTISANLTNYQNDYGITLTNMNTTFNNGSNTDIPSLLPVNLGGTRNSQGQLVTTDFPIVITPSDPFAAVPVSALTAAAANALAVKSIETQVLTLRTNAANVIQSLINAGASLTFFDDIQSIRQSVVDMQAALEKGLASSQNKIINYTTPRLMSLREVAFANGIDVNNVETLDLLNPQLDSVNWIPQGITIQVPVS